MTDTASAAPSDAELLAFRREHVDLCLDDLLRAAVTRWSQPTPPAVVEPRMPVGNATLERLREWERDGELLERVWGTLVDQETEICLLRAALVIAVDHIDMAALRISHRKDAAAIEVAHGIKGDSHD